MFSAWAGAIQHTVARSAAVASFGSFIAVSPSKIAKSYIVERKFIGNGERGTEFSPKEGFRDFPLMINKFKLKALPG
ncbi:hypothetical protein CKA32_004186 [Geitlerinema sp. FC II]|nr:hypothetical protein CKA32_004186 [Geitlerinema sp. FC II]